MSPNWLFRIRALFIVGVGVFVAAELLDGREIESVAVASVPPAGADPLTTQNHGDGDAKDLLGTVLDRPLFDSSRHTAQVATPNLSPENPEPVEKKDSIIRVTGIISVGQTKYAFFELDGAQKLSLATAGDEVAGRKIDDITATEVRLMGPDGVITLQPTRNPNAPQNPPPAQPAAPFNAFPPQPANN